MVSLLEEQAASRRLYEPASGKVFACRRFLTDAKITHRIPIVPTTRTECRQRWEKRRAREKGEATKRQRTPEETA